MQTFLPWPDFAESAADLDTPRLGKQRVEVIQILKALHVPGYGWRNHPAVLMWEGHDEALVRYGLAMTDEWATRGYADTCAVQFPALADLEIIRSEEELSMAGDMPDWLGNPDFHAAHRSSLLRKDPVHYGPKYPDSRTDLEYVWPRRSPAVLAREARKRARELAATPR